MISGKPESARKHAPEYRGGEWWCHGKPMWQPKSQPLSRVCNVREGSRTAFGIWTLRELRKMFEADSAEK